MEVKKPMKKLLLVPIISLCTLISGLFLGKINADDCFLFEGTYVGTAVLNGNESEPLFLVAANKHIAGFFAPEDQTHPSGTSINQASLSSGGYALSLTADDKILVKYSNADTLSGKAKLIEVKNGSGTFHGYYTTQDSFSSDFLTIGEDGGTVIRVTAGMDFVFSFGKINSFGKFVQVFPDNGNGPQVDITILGTTASVTILTKNGSFPIQMQRSDVSNCTTTTATGESSSSGGTSSGEPIFVTNFMNALSDILQTEKTVYDFYAPAGNNLDPSTRGDQKFNKSRLKALNKLKGVVKRIQSALKAPSIVCNELLKSQLVNLDNALRQLRNVLCGTTPAPDPSFDNCRQGTFTGDNLGKIGSSLSTLESLSEVDADGNGISDICKQ